MTPKKLDGKIKTIRTKTKAEDEGNVVHTTTLSLEFEDLDRHMLDQLALAEYLGRLVTIELIPHAAAKA